MQTASLCGWVSPAIILLLHYSHTQTKQEDLLPHLSSSPIFRCTVQEKPTPSGVVEQLASNGAHKAASYFVAKYWKVAWNETVAFGFSYGHEFAPKFGLLCNNMIPPGPRLTTHSNS